MRKILRFRIWEYSCLEHYTHRDITYFVICLIIAVLCANKFKLHYCKYFQDPVKISQKINSKMWASQFVYQLWKPKASTQPSPFLPHKSTAKNLLTYIVNYSKKCQVIFKNHQIKINESDFTVLNLEILSETKFLGIILDKHLNFVIHINSIIRKFNVLLMMMRYLRKFLNQKTMVNLYYSFIYPHLIYGVEFWGHAPDYALEQILICQKKGFEDHLLQTA